MGKPELRNYRLIYVVAVLFIICGLVGSAAAQTVSFLNSYQASFKTPTGIAVNSLGVVYFTDPPNNQVILRESNGRLLERKQFSYGPVGIAIDNLDRIYLSDKSAGSVTVYNSSWVELFKLGQGNGEFMFPGDIAINFQSTNVYVSDTNAHNVKIYDSSGTFIKSFGEFGFGFGNFIGPGLFRFPMGIAINPNNGWVYVVDQQNYRVQLFDEQGNYINAIGRQGFFPGRFSNPQSVWVDDLNRIYVTDSQAGRVQVFNQNGSHRRYIADFGKAPGQLLNPVDLLIDSFSRLFIASATNGRLEIYGIDSFTNPETINPALINTTPNILDRAIPKGTVSIDIEVQGYNAEDIDVGTVKANGVPAITESAVIGNYDNNFSNDLKVEFDWDSLLATMPFEGVGNIFVAGNIGSKVFEGNGNVLVLRPAEVDSDGDGVLDENDLCPDTPEIDVVDMDGCSIYQICPCVADPPWKNHGMYVSCLTNIVNDFIDMGLIMQGDFGELTKQAQNSQCGGK